MDKQCNYHAQFLFVNMSEGKQQAASQIITPHRHRQPHPASPVESLLGILKYSLRYQDLSFFFLLCSNFDLKKSFSAELLFADQFYHRASSSLHVLSKISVT